MKRTIAFILLALTAVAVLAVPALAHTVPEPGKTGRITITMRYDGKPISGGELMLYRVGKVAQEDGNYFFVKTGSFTQWDGEFGDLENTKAVAQELESFVKKRGIIGTSAQVIAGKAVFGNNAEGLAQGLYLIIQTVPAEGYSALSPFLVSLPYFDGKQYQYDIQVYAKNEQGKLPQTGQLWWPVPVLTCVGLICVGCGLIRRRRNRDEA